MSPFAPEPSDMLSPLLQDRAAFYVAGSMSAAERDNFELILLFHEELRAFVADAQRPGAALAMAGIGQMVAPPPSLKTRLLRSVAQSPRTPVTDALVMTDALGRIEWVNAPFTTMCGFSLEELRGRKPGALLQGPATDPAAVARLRDSLRSVRACRETLVNYHKDGSTYTVDIQISPVVDDAGHPLWFIAQERKVSLAGVAGG